MIRVKICGNTNLEDARIAVDAGASLLGFIFYPKSPRCISVGGAREVSRALRGRAALVGVFVNAGEDEVRATLRDAELDLAQLHGDEPVRAVAAFAGGAYKAMRRGDIDGEGADAYSAVGPTDAGLPQLLLDADHATLYGGTGQRADEGLAARLARHCRLLLAGGLTPDNVAGAIAAVHPWGVDVASGVEREPGRKDADKVRAFVAAARLAAGR
ncbi:MAG: phosphoribosylanthranilate isomerase [Thermoflexales bacterium]|nr:phosphoribosylanthranilate isomerase [Thermoflexales bacterium]